MATLPGGGRDVDLSGDTATSLGSGGTRVFVEQGGVWSEQAMFFTGDTSVSVWQDTLVGGNDWSGSCSTEGAAWAHARAGTTWSPTQQFSIDGHDAPGHSTWVGVDGAGTPFVVLGDPAEDMVQGYIACDWGEVLVYRWQGTQWVEATRIQSNLNTPTYGFGWDVAADGDVIVISEVNDVYVMERTGPNTWKRKSSFGGSWSVLDVDGDTLIAGSPSQSQATIRRAQGGNWNHLVVETVVAGAAGSELGASVAVHGDTAVIGAPDQAEGRARVYRRSGTTWTQLVVLAAPSPIASGRFGSAVAIEGDWIVIGEEGADRTHFYTLLQPPTTYCTAKVNSQGCTPAVGFSGCASATDPNPFDVTATQVINNKSGTLFYGVNGRRSTPFWGGTMCVQGPRKRTPLQTSGGNPPPNDCSGVLLYDFNARIQSGADPNLVAGTRVNAQYWYRDSASSFDVGLSDAVEFDVLP